MEMAVPGTVERSQLRIAQAVWMGALEGTALAVGFDVVETAARHMDVLVFSEQRRKASTWR